jgi:hypothetical protein
MKYSILISRRGEIRTVAYRPHQLFFFLSLYTHMAIINKRDAAGPPPIQWRPVTHDYSIVV